MAMMSVDQTIMQIVMLRRRIALMNVFGAGLFRQGVNGKSNWFAEKGSTL